MVVGGSHLFITSLQVTDSCWTVWRPARLAGSLDRITSLGVASAGRGSSFGVGGTYASAATIMTDRWPSCWVTCIDAVVAADAFEVVSGRRRMTVVSF